MSLLDVNELSVTFATPDGDVNAVRKLSFALEAGETLGIVGESGSGKSQTVLASMGLLADNGRTSGSVRFEGRELLTLGAAALNDIRGARMAMIFQDPMTSLNPYVTIGAQMAQILVKHQGLSRRDALARCRTMLDAVHLTEVERRLRQYPHELSGGMRQRVMIAAALLCRPALLIADEPTTALDVTVQAQILRLMRELRAEFGAAIIFITHDLGVVAGLCDRLIVMQRGEAVETGPVDDVFYRPQHEYTRSLLAAVPRLDGDDHRTELGEAADTVLAVDDLRVRFDVRSDRLFSPARSLRAVDGVNLSVAQGETLGLVGESGCGKSTLARAILKLLDPAGGNISVLGQDLATIGEAQMLASRRNLQVVFQDPLASLNPRMTVLDIVAEPLQTHEPNLAADARRERVVTMLERVGLEESHANRYPHEFSGGQCQRIGIARALILQPAIVVCDEPVSALDVTIQRQIVALLIELQETLNLSLVFIAHDLAVVRQISHRIAVMYLGRVVETAPTRRLFDVPLHPYTRALLSAVPVPDPAIERGKPEALLTGDVPSPLDPPSGCAFRTRCRHAAERCGTERPRLRRVGATEVACHFAEQIAAPRQ